MILVFFHAILISITQKNLYRLINKFFKYFSILGTFAFINYIPKMLPVKMQKFFFVPFGKTNSNNHFGILKTLRPHHKNCMNLKLSPLH